MGLDARVLLDAKRSESVLLPVDPLTELHI
jgi:hypothetical protein